MITNCVEKNSLQIVSDPLSFNHVKPKLKSGGGKNVFLTKQNLFEEFIFAIIEGTLDFFLTTQAITNQTYKIKLYNLVLKIL